MKHAALAAAALMLQCGFVIAQDAGTPLKVTTTLHGDGTKTVMKTDPDERTAEATTYDAADRVRQRVVYVLDEQNQPASGIVYDAKGRAAFKSTYKRDGANRIIEQIDYTPADKLVRRMFFEYGANNKVTNVRVIDANGVEVQSKNASGTGSRGKSKQR
jgi:hypothetical protein